MISKRNIKSAFLLFAIVISLMQIGCRKKTVTSYRIPGDGGLLSQEPCGPPCFYGITPGITSKDEAEDILVNSLKLKNCHEYDIDIPGGILSCEGIHHLSYNENYLVTEVGYYLDKDITVKELLEKYGEPNNVATFTFGYHKDFVSSIQIYFSNIVMSVSTEKRDGNSFTVSPETIIDDVTYSIYKETKDNNLFIQEWKGYGEYFMGAGP